MPRKKKAEKKIEPVYKINPGRKDAGYDGIDPVIHCVINGDRLGCYDMSKSSWMIVGPDGIAVVNFEDGKCYTSISKDDSEAIIKAFCLAKRIEL